MTLRYGNSRREFIKLVGGGVAAVYLSGCSIPGKIKSQASLGDKRADFGPFNRSLGDQASRTFSGDQPDLPHHVLWDKESFIASHGGKLPPPKEFADVVVVGGGMSGLISAYMLKDKKPILLEQASRLGGNSKGESWRGIDYSIGAAYTDIPEPGSPIARFWKEIGVDKKFRVWEGGDPLYVGGQVYYDCWGRGTVPGTQEQFKILGKHFLDVLHEKNGLVYPEIPAHTSQGRKVVNELDQISFQTYLEKVLGGPLLPHVEEYIEHYFWTASAGSYSEISAAAGLNFFAGDFEAIAVFPGGNASIAEAVLNRMEGEIGSDRLRTSSLVMDVTVNSDGVLISYLNSKGEPKGEIKTIQAKYAIMACPKFVAAKVVNQLEPERLSAIHSLKYRAYLVANVLVNQPVKDSFYDAFFFDGRESLLKGHVKELAHRQKVTDVVLGSFACRDRERAVLTLSRSMPYDGGRDEIYKQGSYEWYRGEFENQLTQSILPQLGVSEKNMVDLRLTRWGHPLPLSSVGNISSGKVDLIRKPFRDRLFFVEQDNWTLPCFETAFNEALTWTTELRKLL